MRPGERREEVRKRERARDSARVTSACNSLRLVLLRLWFPFAPWSSKKRRIVRAPKKRNSLYNAFVKEKFRVRGWLSAVGACGASGEALVLPELPICLPRFL